MSSYATEQPQKPLKKPFRDFAYGYIKLCEAQAQMTKAMKKYKEAADVMYDNYHWEVDV